MIIPKFVEEKFKTVLYTIEKDAEVGGQMLHLYAADYDNPAFCHTDGIAFNDIDSVIRYLHNYKDYEPYFNNNPIVFEYSVNGGHIVKVSVGTAKSLSEKE